MINFNIGKRKRGIIQRIKDWIMGVNYCPRCKRIFHKYCFGYTEYLCPECFGKSSTRWLMKSGRFLNENL